MTEHETFPGKPYVVTSKAGCTITDASGELEETCEPGKQKVIHAPSEKLFTSAPAIVRETFKRAALALGLLGGGVDKWGKYADCETVEDLQAVNANYKNDLTPEGEWKWKLPKMRQLMVEGKYDGAFFGVRALKKWRVALPMLSVANYAFQDSGITEWHVDLPALVSYAYHAFSCGIVIFAGRLDNLSNGEAMFWYATSLREFRSALPKLSGGNMMFDRTVLDKDSVLRICSSIPAYTSGTHKLTLGIHVDHQTDEYVINAIAEAEAKGWTLAVQWNGTATAAAASTWGRRKPVFARLGEPMADGTPTLDWGHYVTDPSGYTEFASLDEAKEHFNITD